MLVDTRSATNVLFHDAITQMGIPDSDIRPYVIPLIRFTGCSVNSSGIVDLPVQVNGTTWCIEFLVIDNGLIGRPALNQFKAIISTYSFTLEVRTATGLFAIRNDRNTGRECFIATRAEAEHKYDTNTATRLEKSKSNKKLQP